MFGTIRKHQTWLWAIIITLTIISFVVFFSPYSKMNDSRGGPVNLGSINGERVSEEQYIHARNEVFLRHYFMTGSWPDQESTKEGGQIERETYQWLLLIQKQQQLGIHISAEVVAQAARAMVSQFQRAGITSPDVFIRQVLQPRGFQVGDLERFVRHYIGVQELIATAGLAGKLVTPQEARDLFKREHEELATAAVFFSASSYLSNITVLPDAVTQFYSNRLATYRVPDRVQVSYVKFDLTNYAAEASQELARMTNLDLQIDEAFKQGGTNFLREVEAQSLEEAKVKVRDARHKQFEFQAARRKAVEFATPLFDMDPVRADNLDKLAKEKGLAVGITAPFDRETPPSRAGRGTRFRAKGVCPHTGRPFCRADRGLERRVCDRFQQEDPERDSAPGADSPAGGEGVPAEPGAKPGAPDGDRLLSIADQRAGAGQDRRGPLRRRQTAVGGLAALLAQHPPTAGSGRPHQPEPIQANRFLHVAGQGEQLPDDARGRRHRSGEVQIAAGRGEDDREPAGVPQRCPPEPAK